MVWYARESAAPVSAPPRGSTQILDQVPQARQDPKWGSSVSSLTNNRLGFRSSNRLSEQVPLEAATWRWRWSCFVKRRRFIIPRLEINPEEKSLTVYTLMKGHRQSKSFEAFILSFPRSISTNYFKDPNNKCLCISSSLKKASVCVCV